MQNPLDDAPSPSDDPPVVTYVSSRRMGGIGCGERGFGRGLSWKSPGRVLEESWKRREGDGAAATRDGAVDERATSEPPAAIR